MGKHYRQGRLGEEIKKIISEMLINGVKDHRLKSRIITVSAVEVTSDLSYATCYVSPLVLDGEDREEVVESVLAGLNAAKGTLKKQISTKIKLRHTPELIFKDDASAEYGRHIDEIIEKIHSEEGVNE